MTRRPRVGILTFQEALNYGAALQCFALYQTLRNLGCDPKVIDYHNPCIENNEGIVLGPHPKKAAKALLRGRGRRVRAFSNFMHEETGLTTPCNREGVCDVCSGFDFVIAGSDQVWNVNLTGDDSTYFLDFLPNPAMRKSYAASIGLSELPASFDYKEVLAGFSSLLLREATGAKLVKHLLPESMPQVVLDPTLLLSRDDWSHVARGCREAGQRFIACYTVSEREKTLQAAYKLGIELDASVVHVHPSIFDWHRTEGAMNLWDASPYEFVWLFRNATASAVSSFHGVCFSIINHLDFYYATDTGAGSKASRVADLLKLLGIEGRGADDYLAGTQRPIDWESVDERLEELRTDSLSKLAASLNLERQSV